MRPTKTLSRITVTLFSALLSILPIQAQEVYRAEGSSITVQLRSNGLYDIALCPNIGVELQTDYGLAFQLDYTGAWWNNDAKHRYFSNYAFQTELRYYFDKKRIQPYNGHHVGLYAQMITYDFEFGKKGYMCRNLDDTFAIGASYGYSFVLNKHWNLDITAGIAYLHSKYDVYNPNSRGAYTREYTKKKSLFIPTKLEATFVWNINRKNN